MRDTRQLGRPLPWLVAMLVGAVGWAGFAAGPAAASAAELPPPGSRFTTTDSLDCTADPSADTQACLAGLQWQPAEFAVEIEAALPGRGDRLIAFPSPRPVGDPVHDRVTMEWYAAKDDQGQPVVAPAVVVVHESGRSMPVGRMIARGLRGQGLHAMLLHLPGYGPRRTALAERPELLLDSLRQGISDVRRGRDAVACLPLLQDVRIGVQGTSLGGFVIATTIGLDSGFDRAFILLAGGNLHDVVLQGKRDAAKIRQRLHQIGIDDAQIRELTQPIEPLRLAHRIASERTWLYNGMFDDVVPRASSYALAQAAGLPAEQHIELPADHYTGIIFLPVVLQRIHQVMTEPEQP